MRGRRGVWLAGAVTLAVLVVLFLNRGDETAAPPRPVPVPVPGVPPEPMAVEEEEPGEPSDLLSDRPFDIGTPSFINEPDPKPTPPPESGENRTLRGTMVREDGGPLVEPRVMFVQLTESGWARIRGSVGPDGSFEIPNVPKDMIRDSLKINAGAEGYLTVTTRVPTEDLDSREIRIVLQKPVRYTGRFVDEKGNPVRGMRVWAYYTPFDSLGATSDAEGKFSFLAPARHGLLILVEPLFEGAPDQFQLPSDAVVDTDLGDILVVPVGTIRGRVLDHEGTPVAGAEVHLVSLKRTGRSAGRAKTGPDGAFELGGVGAGFYCASVNVGPGRGARAVGLVVGSNVDLIFAPLLAVRIRLLDARTGEPLASVRSLSRIKRSDAPDGHGSYRIWAALHREATVFVTEPGLYDLHFGTPFHLSDWIRGIEVREGEEPVVDFPLHPVEDR